MRKRRIVKYLKLHIIQKNNHFPKKTHTHTGNVTCFTSRGACIYASHTGMC